MAANNGRTPTPGTPPPAYAKTAIEINSRIHTQVYIVELNRSNDAT